MTMLDQPAPHTYQESVNSFIAAHNAPGRDQEFYAQLKRAQKPFGPKLILISVGIGLGFLAAMIAAGVVLANLLK